MEQEHGQARLDAALFSRGLAPSRAKARVLIERGWVKVNGAPCLKPSRLVEAADEIQIAENDELKYVSRGGFKLEKAIQVFELDLRGKTVLDIGSSTGGFTDCALQHGASRVIAVDLGSDIMDARLRQDAPVELHERTDIRNFPVDQAGTVDVLTMDVSFISVQRIVEVFRGIPGDFSVVCLIKPQFEVGRVQARKHKGVIRDGKLHRRAIEDVVNAFAVQGFFLNGLSYSPITGGDGNIEYLALFRKRPAGLPPDVDEVIRLAHGAMGKA